MADTFIILSPDGAGKKAAVQSRAQGANTVYNAYWADFGKRQPSGSYSVVTAATAWAASANTLGTGFFYLYNPLGSTLRVALLEINLRISRNASAVDVTSPRLLLERFTYTGTPSGATVAIGALDSTFPTATAEARSAGTGMTVTTAGAVTSWLPGVTLTTATSPMACNNIVDSDWTPNEIGQLVLGAGEGVAFWQPDAGSTTNRIFQAQFSFEEYTIPA